MHGFEEAQKQFFVRWTKAFELGQQLCHCLLLLFLVHGLCILDAARFREAADIIANIVEGRALRVFERLQGHRFAGPLQLVVQGLGLSRRLAHDCSTFVWSRSTRQ